VARVVDEVAQRAKRRTILELASELVRTKGYEKMTIQDILDGLGISRGALYHYFDSKEAILGALVDQMGSDAADALLPIVRDPKSTALEKFRSYVETSARVKADRPELVIGMLRTWYSDDNVLLRHKVSDAALTYTAPLILEPIIQQGVEEHTFTTRFPQQVARIIAGIALSQVDTLVGLLFSDDSDEVVQRRSREFMDAYTDSIERILGAQPGSLRDDRVDQLLTLSLRARAKELARGGVR